MSRVRPEDKPLVGFRDRRLGIDLSAGLWTFELERQGGTAVAVDNPRCASFEVPPKTPAIGRGSAELGTATYMVRSR